MLFYDILYVKLPVFQCQKVKIFMSNHHLELSNVSSIQFEDMKILHCSNCFIQYWKYPEAYFRYWCIYWNKTPGAWINFKSQKIELTPNKIILIPPFTPFSTGINNPVEHFYIHFYTNGILDKIRRNPIKLDTLDLSLTISEIFNLSGTAQLLKIYGLIFSYLAKIPVEYCLAETEDTINPIIRKVIDLMHENINVPIDNFYLSRQAGLGINEFYNLFKQEMHITPRQYMLRLRLEHSSTLLRYSKQSIEKIAQNCGFADRYHFSKAFRSYFGFPPVEFRKIHEKQTKMMI